MDTIHERLERAYNFLKDRGLIHTRVQFGKAIGKSESQISQAFKNVDRRCTLGLMKRIADTFPDILNREYLLTGEGAVALPGAEMVPYFEQGAAAGFMAGISDPDYGNIMRPTNPDLAPYDFTIQAVGDSMSPCIQSGAILACRFLHDRANLPIGKVIVLDTIEGAIVKELRWVNSQNETLTLHSFNSDYPDYEIPMSSVLNIALVVGYITIL